MTAAVPYTSRPIRPDLVPVLAQLQAGMRVRITQTVRVGLKSWPHIVEGTLIWKLYPKKWRSSSAASTMHSMSLSELDSLIAQSEVKELDSCR